MPFIESLVDFKHSVMKSVVDDADLDQNGPHLEAYVKMFRALPEMQPWYMNTHAA